MGHAHVVVVHHHGQIVGRRSVRAEDDQIVQRCGLPAHGSLHRIVDHDSLIQRSAEAHGVRLGQIVDARFAVAPGRDEVAALGLGLVPQGRGLVGGQEVTIGVAGRQQFIDHLAVTVGARELEDRLFVAEQLQPGQAVEDGLHRLVRRTLAIGVLDADQEFAAASLGVQPIE
ncbi:hypothetical protein D3C73_911030 [compost metagenome]